MSKVFIEESTLTAIGDSIRDKTGKKDLISPLNMPTEIENIKGGNIIKTVSGTCPITLENCAEGNLLDYKIYGAEGGVGDPTKNLFSTKNVTGSGIRIEQNDSYPGVEFLHFIDNENGLVITGAFKENTRYTFSTLLHRYSGSAAKHANYRWRYTDGTSSRNFMMNKDTVSTSVSDEGKTVQSIAVTASYSTDTLIDLSITQLEEGTVATSFEPNGLAINMNIDNNVYRAIVPGLESSLGTSDYTDYKNRVVVKDGLSYNANLPEIPLQEGTNTFDVITTIKPSNVSLTYVKSVEFNTMKTIEGALPLTVAGVGQKLEDYKIYGAYGDALYYGDANEYIGYDYITTNQGSGASNKAGFNSGIKWNEVNKFRFSIRNNTTQENNMIFAAKATNENVGSALVSPWIGLGQVKYQSNSITSLTYANHPDPGVFGVDTLTFATPTSTNYIWVASWMDSAWSRNNDWGFVEFYKDDTLVAAFYPAKRVSDGVFGFYNKVSRDFITCGASESAFVGHAELSNSVGELLGNYYIIPININGSITNIESSARLGANDYIDFENRKVVIGGVSTHIDLPEIYLQNGQNIIDVDTTVKPSKMSVSYIDNDGGYDAGYKKGYDVMKLAIDMSDVDYRFNETITSYPSNWYRINLNFTDANGKAYKQMAPYTSSSKININYTPTSGSAVNAFNAANNPAWADEAYRTIHIKDGTMTGDAKAFAWLMDNGVFNPTA